MSYQDGYQQGGYPGYQPGPPGYGYSGAPTAYGTPYGTQQSTTNVVVVGQPTSSRTTIIRSSGDHFLTLSIVMTFICVFCGGLLPAVLTVAAIFVALSAKEDDARGDQECARRKGRIVLILNIVSVVLSSVVVFAIMIGIIVNAVKSVSYCSIYTTCYSSYSTGFTYSYSCCL